MHKLHFDEKYAKFSTQINFVHSEDSFWTDPETVKILKINSYVIIEKFKCKEKSYVLLNFYLIIRHLFIQRVKGREKIRCSWTQMSKALQNCCSVDGKDWFDYSILTISRQ